MSNFAKAHAFVAKWEGGLTDHPADPGGITNYGVSLRWLRGEGIDIDGDGDIDADDIRALTPGQAAELFRAKFWDKYHLDNTNASFGTILYDSIVNMGPSQATKVVQRGWNSIAGYFNAPALVVDGILGNQTLGIGVYMTKNDRYFVERSLLDAREAFYTNLVAKKPAFKPFKKGWLARVNDLRNYVRGL